MRSAISAPCRLTFGLDCRGFGLQTSSDACLARRRHKLVACRLGLRCQCCEGVSGDLATLGSVAPSLCRIPRAPALHRRRPIQSCEDPTCLQPVCDFTSPTPPITTAALPTPPFEAGPCLQYCAVAHPTRNSNRKIAERECHPVPASRRQPRPGEWGTAPYALQLREWDAILQG